MAYGLYPDPAHGPLAVPAGERRTAPFTALSAPDPVFSPPYTQVMFLRVALLGTTGTPPRLALTAGTGDTVELTADPRPVFAAPDDSGYLGDASVSSGGPGVSDVLIGLITVNPAVAWQLTITNTDTVTRAYTWLVTDTAAETAHPWTDPGPFTYQATATVPVAVRPYLAAVDAGLRTAVIGGGPAALLHLDDATATTNLPNLPPVLALAVDPITHTAYFSNTQAAVLFTLNLEDRTAATVTIPPMGATGIVVDAHARALYAWGYDLAAGPNMFALHIIDCDTHAVTALPVGAVSGGQLAFDASTSTVCVTSDNPDALVLYHLPDRSLVRIPVAKPVRDVAVDPVRGRAYLTCPHDNAVITVDLHTHDTDTIAVGNTPGGVAVDADRYTVYVANRLDNTLTALDTRTGTGVTVPAGPGAQGVAVDPVSHTVVVANTTAGTATLIQRRSA
jgi:hypothetical protein